MLKFEAGKKYNTRNKDLGPVEVIGIVNKGNYQVIGIDNHNETLLFTKEGTFFSDGTLDGNDLISEHKEPALLLTPDDVGRKVELSNGNIVLVTDYVVEGDRYIAGGYVYIPDGTSAVPSNPDIIQILD